MTFDSNRVINESEPIVWWWQHSLNVRHPPIALWHSRYACTAESFNNRLHGVVLFSYWVSVQRFARLRPTFNSKMDDANVWKIASLSRAPIGSILQCSLPWKNGQNLLACPTPLVSYQNHRETTSNWRRTLLAIIFEHCLWHIRSQNVGTTWTIKRLVYKLIRQCCQQTSNCVCVLGCWTNAWSNCLPQ